MGPGGVEAQFHLTEGLQPFTFISLLDALDPDGFCFIYKGLKSTRFDAAKRHLKCLTLPSIFFVHHLFCCSSSQTASEPCLLANSGVLPA